MDACSGMETFRRGGEYGWLSVKKVTFVGGSTLAPAFAGTHAPGRAGLHFDLFDSVSDREYNRDYATHSIRV